MQKRNPRVLFGSVVLIGLAYAASPVFAADEIQVTSPDQLIRIKVSAPEGRLQYAVSFRNETVIETSPLVVTLGTAEITQGVELSEPKRYELHETYPWRGVHALATNHCVGAVIPLKHTTTGTRFNLELRAFNDGVAYSYVIPSSGKARVPDEMTSFRLPAGSTVWYHDLEGHYEAVHQKKQLDEVVTGQWAAPPLTFRLPRDGGFASITEAALDDYSGMAFQAEADGLFKLVLGHKHPPSYPYRLRYSNDVEMAAKPGVISGAINSPWRVVMIGADLNTLVNSDLIPNLCPPPSRRFFPQGINTDWIKPGRAVWKYLDGGRNTFEEMKEFSRMAGELGFEYNVIEGFWSRWTDDQLRELVQYSKERGVRLWLWKHSKDLRTAEARENFFEKLEDLGVVGAKIDFFDHEHKGIIDLYHSLLESAAQHKILVNFHGANKPTGEPRTWPNELVREGVRGMESSRLQARARHDATLPFTRFLAGHADYTPVHFGARRGDTTWAHQIATAAVFTAPLLTYGAHPTNILNNPALPMIKSVPAAWDQTIVLPMSEIGEVAAFARRKGDTWFVAVVNGPSGRTIQVPLSFLPEGEYKAELVRDHKTESAAVELETKTTRRGESLAIDLSPGGGFIGRFSIK